MHEEKTYTVNTYTPSEPGERKTFFFFAIFKRSCKIYLIPGSFNKSI